MPQIRAVVNGALGRMGSTVLAALEAAPETTPVGGTDSSARAESVSLSGGSGEVPLSRDLTALIKLTQPDVVVDFTNAEGAMTVIRTAVPAGVRVVSGSTGMTAEGLREAARLATQHRIGVVSASNFTIGAVLLNHLAGIAARYFDYADIIESHHEAKIDAPSGTALSIAQAMAAGRGRPFATNVPEKRTLDGTRGGGYEGISIHSARMPGRLARHEVVFGGPGQTLSFVHDTINRDCYMPGVLLAVNHVMGVGGLVVGLDSVLGLTPSAKP